MNKLLLILIAGFSLGSYANSYGVTYNSWDIEGTRLDGIGLTLLESLLCLSIAFSN